MATEQKAEYWLTGPVEGIIPSLQPAAHAILQSRRELNEALQGFPDELIWHKPAGVASVAFHLQHIPGVLDRLFSYANGKQLSASQLDYLQNEGKEISQLSIAALLQRLNQQVDSAIDQLQKFPEKAVFETRFVGRKQIPSNTIGLLFHAAEHMQRHTGQLLVTAKVLTYSNSETKHQLP